MVDHVNEHGGWTIVGWFLQGEVADSANEKEKVASVEITPHVSFLIPTISDVVTTYEFKALQINIPAA